PNIDTLRERGYTFVTVGQLLETATVRISRPLAARQPDDGLDRNQEFFRPSGCLTFAIQIRAPEAARSPIAAPHVMLDWMAWLADS
ncbi:MAG: hypothetical protein ACJ8KO_16340, partial [Sulfurifustaceae bacterium]